MPAHGNLYQMLSRVDGLVYTGYTACRMWVISVNGNNIAQHTTRTCNKVQNVFIHAAIYRALEYYVIFWWSSCGASNAHLSPVQRRIPRSTGDTITFWALLFSFSLFAEVSASTFHPPLNPPHCASSCCVSPAHWVSCNQSRTGGI